MLLLRKAMAWQTETMIQTILGLGMDNHLLGLKEIATELGRPTPPVFQDATFTMCNQFTLSTSQVIIHYYIHGIILFINYPDVARLYWHASISWSYTINKYVENLWSNNILLIHIFE